MTNQTILITGCSTGIGRALALEFHRLGQTVIATARKPGAIADLAAQGLRTAALDVTDPETIASLAGTEIDMLVNNAGYGAMGPLLALHQDTLRRQFDTNVFGLLDVTRALADGMIARRRGRIVNIGSVSGVTATPFSGAYCASKFAVRAISDTLRLELAPFGVDVVEIQPGAIRSEFGATASHGLPELAGGPYAPLTAAMRRRSTMSQRKALSADDFARRVARAVLRDRPPPVVRAGPFSITLPFIGTFLPASLRNRLLRRRFGL